MCHRAGMSLALWSFVAPHGTLELPAIFIAGGAGLILGHGLVVRRLIGRGATRWSSGGLAVRCCSASSRC